MLRPPRPATGPLLAAGLVTGLVAPGAATAQGLRISETNRFTTRAEALAQLLPNDSNSPGVVVIGDDTDPFVGLTTNCAIGARPSDLSDGGAITGPIGPDLSRYCDGGGNESTGVALGGGLGSLQPFRTVALPQTDRADGEEEAFDLGPALGFLPGAPMLAFAGGGRSGLVAASFTDLTLEDTDFAPGAAIDGRSVEAAATWRTEGGMVLTASLSLGDYEGDVRSDLDAPATFESAFLNSEALANELSFADICGIEGGGDVEGTRTALRLAGRSEIGAGRFVELGLGAHRSRDSYALQNCTVNEFEIDDVLNEVFAGTLSGDPVTWGLDLQATFGARRGLGGGATLTPYADARLFLARREGFTEREAPANATISFPGDPLDGTTTFPLGTALVFDGETTARAEMRLGVDLDIPIRLGRIDGALRLGAAMAQLVGEGQERYTARFVEDGRDDPFDFSFLGRPVDRRWGELSAGLSLALTRSSRLDLSAGMSVGDDVADRRSLGAAFVMAF